MSLVKLASDFTIDWIGLYGGTNYDDGFMVYEISTGGYI